MGCQGVKYLCKDGRELKPEENKTAKDCVFPLNVRKEVKKVYLDSLQPKILSESNKLQLELVQNMMSSHVFSRKSLNEKWWGFSSYQKHGSINRSLEIFFHFWSLLPIPEKTISIAKYINQHCIFFSLLHQWSLKCDLSSMRSKVKAVS